MSYLSLTLLADGASDKVLLPFVERLMDEYCPRPYEHRYAEGLPSGAKTVAQRIKAALDLYPCDLLFVHRDAENIEAGARENEIRLGFANIQTPPPHLICVVPVRMTEAWLLTSELAIRTAVGNPNGTNVIALPSVNRVESVDAKDVLFKALEAAKDLGLHRARKFKPERYRHRVSELLPNLDGVRKLRSFQHLELQVAAHFRVEKC